MHRGISIPCFPPCSFIETFDLFFPFWMLPFCPMIENMISKLFHLFSRQTKQASYRKSHKNYRHENGWDFLDFYRNAALIKYFTNNQYYVTDLMVQRINHDFQYVVLPMWEKPGVRNPPVCQAAVLNIILFFSLSSTTVLYACLVSFLF
jgi:hypothetical protein